MSISVSLSLSFSRVFFFHLLSPLLLAGDKSRRGYRRLEGDVRTEQHAKSNPPAGLSLTLLFSDTVCLSFHPHDLARRQTYASELLRTIELVLFVRYVCWILETFNFCSLAIMSCCFVWGERDTERAEWIRSSLRIDFPFLSESCEAAKWCGFANACVFRCILKMQFRMVS